MGADDYINKPFRPRELVSRIRSVLRRTGKSQKLLKEGSITVDTVKGIVYRNGEELALSALEYRLLLIFLTIRVWFYQEAVCSRKSGTWQANSSMITR